MSAEQVDVRNSGERKVMSSSCMGNEVCSLAWINLAKLLADWTLLTWSWGKEISWREREGDEKPLSLSGQVRSREEKGSHLHAREVEEKAGAGMCRDGKLL